jgi:hypothetical protein
MTRFCRVPVALQAAPLLRLALVGNGGTMTKLRVAVADVVEDARGLPTMAGRSPLYRWMRRHHDELAEKWAGLRIDWVATCERLAAVGLTDRNGKPPSSSTARQTWLRVRRDLAKARRVRCLPRPEPDPVLDFEPARWADGAGPAEQRAGSPPRRIKPLRELLPEPDPLEEEVDFAPAQWATGAAPAVKGED